MVLISKAGSNYKGNSNTTREIDNRSLRKGPMRPNNASPVGLYCTTVLKNKEQAMKFIDPNDTKKEKMYKMYILYFCSQR
jgi:hypothetical protein